jgi:cytochrome b
MSVLLWSLILSIALSGWNSRWDRFRGADWPLDLHAWLSSALQISVMLHLAGVALSSALERQNLVGTMPRSLTFNTSAM